MMWVTAPWMRIDASGAWYAEHTSDGPATVRIRKVDGAVKVASWGPGAERLVAAVPELLGLGDNAVTVAGLASDHPVVKRLIRDLAGYRMGRSTELYSPLVTVALAQKVTGKNSSRATANLVYKLGTAAPGPRDDLRLLPEPKLLARTPYYELHPLNIERRRAELICSIATRIHALRRAVRMNGPDALAHLQKLPGIGPWTAGVVCGGPLGHPDAVPVGDYHLPNFVAFNLTGEMRADDATMLELLEPYAGRRGQVARMIKGGGKKPPRMGPRMSVVDIKGR